MYDAIPAVRHHQAARFFVETGPSTLGMWARWTTSTGGAPRPRTSVWRSPTRLKVRRSPCYNADADKQHGADKQWCLLNPIYIELSEDETGGEAAQGGAAAQEGAASSS